MRRSTYVALAVALLLSTGCAAIVKAVPLVQTGLDLLDFGQELAKDGKGSLEKIQHANRSAAFLAVVVEHETGETAPPIAGGESTIAYTSRLLQWVASFRLAELEAEGLIEPAE